MNGNKRKEEKEIRKRKIKNFPAISSNFKALKAIGLIFILLLSIFGLNINFSFALSLKPSIILTPNSQQVTTSAVFTAVATDYGDNAGIIRINFYEDGRLIESHNCNRVNPCTKVFTVTHFDAGSHSYYASATDLDGNLVNSKTVYVVFTGIQNRAPIIVSVNPQSPVNIDEGSTITFSINAYDPDNDILSYSWQLDGRQVGTNSNRFTYSPDYFSDGHHSLTVTVSDGKESISFTWDIYVNNVLLQSQCTINVNPGTNILYTNQPLTVSCNCNNPEANSKLLRNGKDVSNENNKPVWLPAGSYAYRCETPQTYNYRAASAEVNVVINKATPSLHLAFNNNERDLTLNYPADVEVRAWLDIDQNINNAKLYRNGSLVGVGSPVIENPILSAGVWNYTYVYEESQNYTQASLTRILTILPIQTELQLNAIPDWNIDYGDAVNISCQANNNEVLIELWIDNEKVNEGYGDINYYVNPYELAAGSYSVVCNTSGNENYSRDSKSNTLTINLANSNITLLLNGNDADITINQGETVNHTAILNVPSQGIVRIFVNGTEVANGNSPLEWLFNYDVGYYNVSAVFDGNQNYTSSIATHFITVNPLPDTEPPVVTLIAPSDLSIDNDGNVTIVYNVTDNAALTLSCDIYSNISGNWQIDANQIVTNASTNSYDYYNLADGYYVWNVRCFDGNNYAFAQDNFSFIVNTTLPDTEPPFIAFVPPTPENETTLNQNWVYINTTITDNVAVALALLEWNGVNESMNGAEPIYYVNKTGLSDGVYVYRVYASDTSGNWNVSETRIVYINTTSNMPPYVELIWPDDGYMHNSTSINLSFYAHDDLSNLLDCWLYTNISNWQQTDFMQINNATTNNFSLSNLENGIYLWNVECNDGNLSNFAISNRTFIINVTHDVGIDNNYSNSINGIRLIDNETGQVILDDPANLTYGKKYTARARIMNYGNMPEEVRVIIKIVNQTDEFVLANYTTTINQWHYAQATFNTSDYGLGNYFVVVHVDLLNYTDDNLNNNERNRSFNIVDVEPPQWFNENVNPPSPTTYGNGPYTFSIDWQDNIAIDTVIFEFNNQNYTANCSNLPAKTTTCSFSFNDLAANETGYIYRWYANDTSGNMNSTPLFTYIINKASMPIHLYLNGAENNLTIIYSETELVNITGTKAFNEGTLEILINDSLESITNENTIELLRNFAAGTYAITLRFNETQNYTSNLITLLLQVNKATPNLNIIIDPNNTIYNTPVNVTTLGCPTQLQCNLYRNGTWIGEGNLQITENLAAGYYIYEFNTSGNENYTSASVIRDLLINKALTNLVLNASPDWNIDYGDAVNISCQANNNEVLIELWIDNEKVNEGYGDINYYVNPYELAAGSYNVVCNTSGNENYSGNSTLEILNINKAIPNLSLNATPSWQVVYGSNVAIIASGCPTIGASDIDCGLWLNGNLVNNTPVNGELSYTFLPSAGSYSFIINTTDGQNWSAASISNVLTVNPKPVEIILLLNGSASNLTTSYPATINVTAYLNETADVNLTLWRDNNLLKEDRYIEVIEDLAAGVYAYKANLTDNQNYSWQEKVLYLTINKAQSQVNLLINNNDSATVFVNESINISCQLITPESGYLNIFDNASILNITGLTNNGWLNTTISYNIPGVYNITCAYLGNENYTESYDSKIVKVIMPDVIPPQVTLVSPNDNFITNNATINFTFIATDNEDTNLTCYLLTNESGNFEERENVDALNNTLTNITHTFTSSGVYLWNIKCIDDRNNNATAITNRTIIIDLEPPIAENLTIIPNQTYLGRSINISAKVTDNFNVSSVKAIIDYPNGEQNNITMSNIGNNTYFVQFNDTWVLGDYNVTIFARDIVGNINNSVKGSFKIKEEYHDLALENITGLKLVPNDNGTLENKSLENTTIYLYDTVYFIAYINNKGEFDEINAPVYLLDNGNIINTTYINISSGETKQVVFRWNAQPKGYHFIKIYVANDDNNSNNDKGINLEVWSVKDTFNLSWHSDDSYPSSNENVGVPFWIWADIDSHPGYGIILKDLVVTLDIPSQWEILDSTDGGKDRILKFDFNGDNTEWAWWYVNATSPNPNSYIVKITIGNIGDNITITRNVNIR